MTQTLVEENANLQLMVKNLELELQHAKSHIIKIHTEKQDIQSSLEQIRSNHQANINQMENQHAELMKLRNQLKQSTETKSHLEKVNKEIMSVNDKLSSDLRRANEGLSEKTVRIQMFEQQLRESRLNLEKLQNLLKLQNLENQQNLEKLKLDNQSLQEIINVKETDYKSLWDSMIFYKNKVDFSPSDKNLQGRIATLEKQLEQERKTKNDLMLENSHLKGPKDPDDCDICFQQLPVSRCLTPNCKQIFHNQCIKQWFDNKPNKDCPKCKLSNVKIGAED